MSISSWSGFVINSSLAIPLAFSRLLPILIYRLFAFVLYILSAALYKDDTAILKQRQQKTQNTAFQTAVNVNTFENSCFHSTLLLLEHASSLFKDISSPCLLKLEADIITLKEHYASIESELQILQYDQTCSRAPLLPSHGGLRAFLNLIDFLLQRLYTKLRIVAALPRKSFILSSHGDSPLNVLPFQRGRKAYTEIHEIHQNLKDLLQIFPYMILLVRDRKVGWHNSRLDKPISNPFDAETLEGKLKIEPFWYKSHPELQKFRELMDWTYATLGSSHKVKSRTPIQIRKHASTVVNAVHCTLSPSTARRKTANVCEALDIALLQRIWNLPETLVVSTVNSMSWPSVVVSQRIVIPSPLDSPLKGDGISARIISAKPLPFSITHLIPTSTGYVTSLKKALSSITLDTMALQDHVKEPPSLPLIFHVHGGGFVSGSSAAHENYLREWAIATGIPIISIDYKLAPAYKCPTQLLECFYAYKWLISSCHLGMYVSRIAVVGDSAGGNMCAGLTLKCIQENVKVPDGLILHYPAVDLTTTIYPSRMLFIGDPIVPAGAAKICRESYLSNCMNEEELKDPLISPLYAPDCLLEKLPMTFITASEFDPLSDEAIMFAERLQGLQHNTTLKVYSGMPHGFLSVAHYAPDVRRTIFDTVHWFKEILGL